MTHQGGCRAAGFACEVCGHTGPHDVLELRPPDSIVLRCGRLLYRMSDGFDVCCWHEWTDQA